jgi:hypothetical protein
MIVDEEGGDPAHSLTDDRRSDDLGHQDVLGDHCCPHTKLVETETSALN